MTKSERRREEGDEDEDEDDEDKNGNKSGRINARVGVNGASFDKLTAYDSASIFEV